MDSWYTFTFDFTKGDNSNGAGYVHLYDSLADRDKTVGNDADYTDVVEINYYMVQDATVYFRVFTGFSGVAVTTKAEPLTINVLSVNDAGDEYANWNDLGNLEANEVKWFSFSSDADKEYNFTFAGAARYFVELYEAIDENRASAVVLDSTLAGGDDYQYDGMINYTATSNEDIYLKVIAKYGSVGEAVSEAKVKIAVVD